MAHSIVLRAMSEIMRSDEREFLLRLRSMVAESHFRLLLTGEDRKEIRAIHRSVPNLSWHASERIARYGTDRRELNSPSWRAMTRIDRRIKAESDCNTFENYVFQHGVPAAIGIITRVLHEGEES